MIPKVEWATVYIDFPRQGVVKEMGLDKEVTGDGSLSSLWLCTKHFEDQCFVTEGVRYRINGHRNFKAT